MATFLPHTTNNTSASSSTSTYTCLSCQIQFTSMQLQRIHMKTEWHRYNLKRRVAQMIPVSNEVFQLKVASTKDQVKYDDFGFVIEEEKEKPKSKSKSLRHDLLTRGRRLEPVVVEDSSRDVSPAVSETSTFSLGTLRSNSEFEYESDDVHSTISTQLKAETTDYNSDVSDEQTDSDYYENLEEHHKPLDLTDCFYCGTQLDSVDTNIQHMIINHSLYIPNFQYLSDKEGLLRFLSDTIVVDKECIKCGYFSNKLIGIRQHIIAKGHACIPYESKEMKDLVDKYYDFSQGDSDSEGDELVEDDDTDDYSVATIDSTGVELALPNGYKIGHRSMSKYYKQNAIQPRRMSEGELTISAINRENEKLLHLQATTLMKNEAKEISRVNLKLKHKELSDSGLKYRNKHEHYQNQRFG